MLLSPVAVCASVYGKAETPSTVLTHLEIEPLPQPKGPPEANIPPKLLQSGTILCPPQPPDSERIWDAGSISHSLLADTTAEHQYNIDKSHRVPTMYINILTFRPIAHPHWTGGKRKCNIQSGVAKGQSSTLCTSHVLVVCHIPSSQQH